MNKARVTDFYTSVVILIVTCLFVSTASASIVELKELQFSLESVPYYSSQTIGFSQSASVNGDVAIPTGPSTVDWAYSIQDAVVTLSNMAMTSAPGGTTATFAGPAMLTVAGKLIRNSDSAVLEDGPLLVAGMDSASLTMYGVTSTYAVGAATFTTSGGALYGGVADGGDSLVLDDFDMGLYCSGTTVLFGASNTMTPFNVSVQLTTDAIPEPATIGLLSMGTAILLRRRRSN